MAVAAASILARERFVNGMDAAGEAAGMKLPLGASGQVVKAARQLVAQHGEQMLPKVAKMCIRDSFRPVCVYLPDFHGGPA